MSYVIRPCETLDELGACVTLQKQIWGYADQEVYPLRLFVTLTQIGGRVLGAFTAQGELVGFVASMPAWHGRRRYYHSLSMGVLPAHENRGLGRALKLEQRKAALRAGIDSIEWTYDPLRAKNASLVQGIFPVVFVVLFLSSAFFPQHLLSSPADLVAEYNPLSYIADGMRYRWRASHHKLGGQYGEAKRIEHD